MADLTKRSIRGLLRLGFSKIKCFRMLSLQCYQRQYVSKINRNGSNYIRRSSLNNRDDSNSKIYREFQYFHLVPKHSSVIMDVMRKYYIFNKEFIL